MQSAVLGIPCDFIDYGEAVRCVHEWINDGARHYVVFVNPHSVMIAQGDEAFRRAIVGAGLVLPDGIGMIVAARLKQIQNAGRVTGPEFMLRLCEFGRAHRYRHFLCGGAAGVAEGLSERLCQRFEDLMIAGVYSPPFGDLTDEENREIVNKINVAKPDVVWIGLGAPKQEKWIAEYGHLLSAPVIAGVGAAFDFHSGAKPWAPSMLRWAGLEWIFRLLCEPKRMWRRNVNSPIFVMRIVAEMWGYKK